MHRLVLRVWRAIYPEYMSRELKFHVAGSSIDPGDSGRGSVALHHLGRGEPAHIAARLDLKRGMLNVEPVRELRADVMEK